MPGPTNNTVNYDTPEEMSPMQMAVDAIEQRLAQVFSTRMGGRVATDADKTLYHRIHDEAKSIFEDTVKRLGEPQAIADATSGAVGLPLDPRARQAEIEKRRRENNAAEMMQMGHGEQYAILENRMQTGLHEQVADFTRPELSPGARPGNGERINRQIAMVRTGMIDPTTGETFNKPQQKLMEGKEERRDEKPLTPTDEQRHRELLARTKDLQASRRPAA